MAQWHLRSKRAPSGKLIKRNRKKKRSDRGMEFLETKIEKRKYKAKKARGNIVKIKLLSEQNANVTDPKTKKVSVSKIISVQENRANPHYIRRNIITKGAVIKTEAGLARVTSRPGQHGVVNAVLVSEKK